MKKLIATSTALLVAALACSSGPVTPQDPGEGGGNGSGSGGGSGSGSGSGGGTTPANPPSPISSLQQNLPSGWTVVTDYGFDDNLPAHQDGVSWEVPMGSSGWTAVDWGSSGGGIRLATDATAPGSPSTVLEEIYPPHLSGTGPSKTSFYLPSEQKVYISWVVKWESGFHHNGTSEKLFYFNLDGTGDQFLFEFTYGVEMVQYIREATGYEALRANQIAPNWAGHGDAPPHDGMWLEYELLFDQSTGSVKWWLNGVLHGDHTGVSYTPIRRIDLTATWGGGGDKQGTHSRFTDHILIAVGN